MQRIGPARPCLRPRRRRDRDHAGVVVSDRSGVEDVHHGRRTSRAGAGAIAASELSAQRCAPRCSPGRSVSPGPGSPLTELGYGSGWFIEQVGRREIVFHPGEGL